MKKRVLMGMVTAVFATVAVVGFMQDTIVKENNTIHLQSYPLSKEEAEELRDETMRIHTKYDEFVRVETKQAIQSSQTVFDTSDINETTKQVILEDRVFVKE